MSDTAIDRCVGVMEMVRICEFPSTRARASVHAYGQFDMVLDDSCSMGQPTTEVRDAQDKPRTRMDAGFGDCYEDQVFCT